MISINELSGKTKFRIINWVTFNCIIGNADD